MSDTVRIETLPERAGASVTLRAWTMTTRSSGKVAFVTLRDGTGYLQAVLSKKDVPEAAWDAFGRLTQETSVEVTGTVRAEPRASGGVRPGQGVLLRAHVPRREVEDPAAPHRVLDGGAGSRLERLRREHAAAGGIRRLHRGPLSGAAAGGAGGAGARHRAARNRDAP